MFTKSTGLNREVHKLFHCLFSTDFLPATSASGGSLGNACLEIKLVCPAVLSLDDKRAVQDECFGRCCPDKNSCLPPLHSFTSRLLTWGSLLCPLQASADGPTWCWWLISILPLDPSFQLSLFSCTSLRARLSQLQHILSALLQQPPPRHLLPERGPRGRV